jgi:UDP-N-acetylmuramate--alanine ligase
MIIEHHKIHMVGIGGAGMSALARILNGLGHQVSGTDLRGGVVLEDLGDIGIEIATGHQPELAVAADLVVASSAVPEHDEELQAAAGRGIPVWRRPELLERLTAAVPTIAATGTHGKTTTTGMLVMALMAAGLDPSFIIGGDLAALGTNGHLGEDDLLVLEADEAFRTFESLHLTGLVVTSVEPEHLDHFGTVDDLVDSFCSVAGRVEGPAVACGDDLGAAEVARRCALPTYGEADGSTWRIRDLERGRGRTTFSLEGPPGATRVSLLPPGRHVALNAAGALALGASLGHDLDRLAEGVSRFRGVARRWEHRGTVGGVILYDDYAHHPTEVRVTLEAARETGPDRLWAVFQPHLFSRTERFAGEFGGALALADVVVVTDVYGAREDPVPGITGELVAEAARVAGATVHYVPHRADLARFLAPRVEPGDLVLSLGAGDITLLHTELAVLLAEAS